MQIFIDASLSKDVKSKIYFVSGEFHQTLLKRISFEVAQKVWHLY